MSEVKTTSNNIPLKLSKADFLQYKEKLEQFLSTRKEEYKNLFESFDILKQKKFHLSFLLFSYYNSWVFPYISYNKITRGNIFSSTFEISFIFKKLSKKMNCPFDEKLFIIWYFYIYYNFFIKEKKQKQNALINQMRYLLFETGKIVINLFEKKDLSINSVLNILDANLLCFEYFITNPEFTNFPNKVQKSKKLIFYMNYFHLLKKISIITLKQNKDFYSILLYLDKLEKNSEINDEVNIIMLFNNHIFQDFMKNILDNLDILELKKTIPDYKKKLITFYIHFLKNKYKISNSFKFVIDTLMHSFEHLYNFKHNKNIIIKDIFKNNFNSILLNKLSKSDNTGIINIDDSNQLNSSFFFDSQSSFISFENTKKINLDQTIFFFSFRFDHKYSPEELPILLINGKIKKKEKHIALKIFLKKADNEAYKILISQSKDNMNISIEDPGLLVYTNSNNFCAFYLNGKKLKIYLTSERKKKAIETDKKEIVFNPISKDDNLIFYLGKDDNNNNFYRGKIGPFIIIKAPKKDIIVNKDIDKMILDIISLFENYPYFLINKSDLSKSYDLTLKDYAWQKYFGDKKNYDKIKGNFECLLYLNPEMFKFYKNYMLYDESNFNSENKRIPLTYFYGNQISEFIVTNLKVSISYDENFIKLFISDNGINYLCLLFGYYNQFLKYFLLKQKEHIFEEEELDYIINKIIESIKINILMLGSHSYSKYTYHFSKKIFINLYNCLLNLNKIKPIINDFNAELISLKDINKGILLNHKSNSESTDKIPSSYDLKNKNEYEKFNNNNFIKFNKNYFIGIFEILLTPDFYNHPNIKDKAKLIEKLINQIFRGIKEVMPIIDLNQMENIFYKLMNFVLILINNDSEEKKEQNEIVKNEEKKEQNEIVINEAKNEIVINEAKKESNMEEEKFQSLLGNIFRIIINILNSKTDKDNIELSKNYFNKLFLFVFGYNRKKYNVILAYLNVINETSKIKSNIKFDRRQIIVLKNFLLDLDKDKKSDKDNIIDKKKEKVQYLIISKIYEFIFTKSLNSKLIEINVLESFLKNNSLTKELFGEIQKLLQVYFIDIFKSEKDINNPINDFNILQLNYYFQNIFTFLKFLVKFLKNNKEDDYAQYLKNIYDIMFESQQQLVMKEENLYIYIVYLINYIEFFYTALNNNELQFLFQEEKIYMIIEELFDKCIQSTLIHCEFYFILKDENNSIDKKLVSEIIMEIYKRRLEKIYDEYRLPGNSGKEVDKNDLDFIKHFNILIEKKIISEFHVENYDLKKQTYFENFRSIFFVSDFLKISLNKKYSKKYAKFKDVSQQIKYYKIMIGIIFNLNPDYIEINNRFDFYHTTYHFYEAYDLCNIRINPYFSDEEIQKHETLKQGLEETKSTLLKLKKILLNDHVKINSIYKDYYSKSGQTNDISLKNMLKAIQNTLFNKRSKNMESAELIKNIETDYSSHENLIVKSSSFNNRSSGSTGSNPGQKGYSNSSGSKDSFEGIQSKNYEFIFSLDIYGEFSKYIIVKGVGDQCKDCNNNDCFEEVELSDNNDKTYFNNLNSLIKLINNSNTKNILDKLDKYSTINPKKEIMKIIFGTYFSKSFYENKSFKRLKMIYLNTYNTSNKETKLLDYPSKIKNFMNGLYPSYFLKENSKFFISKIFPITHEFYYNYMIKNHLLNESIILLKTYPTLEEKLNNIGYKKYHCELMKQDRIYYGHIINSEKEELLYFSKDNFEMFDSKKDSNTVVQELGERGFGLSSLKFLQTEAAKMAKEKAFNEFLDEDIFPKQKFNSNKTVIIFYNDIEEIIQKRILYTWQGLEILLKNGKSYMFNMFKQENYDDIIKSLKEKLPNVLFREKDFFRNTPLISTLWKEKKLDTFEYLLYLNKFSSRSYNDISQYYIIPWIVRDFTKLTEINDRAHELYEYKYKNETNNNEEEEQKENKKENKKMKELKGYFRNLKYPVSAQEKHHRNTKKEKFNDEEEKFRAHHGTHYSTSSYLEYYLMRNEPYTSLLVELQNYSQEDPNRLLLRLRDTIAIINTGYDNRELIPEYFSKVDYFININCVFFGFKKNKELVDDIESMWQISPEKKYNNITLYSEFINAHRKLLNSDIISANINIWIDNIFGYMQIPPEKKIINSINVFPKASYEQYTDLHKKLEKLSTKYENKTERILRKFTNKINVIISFGQCPYQIFQEKHISRESPEENEANIEDEEDNYDKQNAYMGTDFLYTYYYGELKNDDNKTSIEYTGIYFEVNPLIEKLFILGLSNELTIIDTNFYNFSDPKKYNWKVAGYMRLPSMCLFNSFQPNDTNYYIYNIKYAFSSFPDESNLSKLYLYANEYLDNAHFNYENKYEKIKFMTCRYLDNSFKIHFVSFQAGKISENFTFSHICEDFVMCCKTISYNSFIIGLRNGKLIKAVLHEFNINDDKNKKKPTIKYEIVLEKFITGHLGSINVLEVDKKNAIVITGGDDNKIFVRKLYDFELLTCIKLKEKFIITMIKLSPTNLLYVTCFNRNLGKSIIFGYSLSGLKFAKSAYSYYKNIEFTRNGNIITLIDDSEIKLLYGHNLNEIVINEEDKDYKKYNYVKQSFNTDSAENEWMQFNDFKNYYGKDRSIISVISKEAKTKKVVYSLKTVKVTNISYFE